MEGYSWRLRVCRAEPGRANVFTRQHRFHVGAPVSFDKADKAISALEYVLGAIGADLVNGLQGLARKRRIAIEQIEAVVEGELNNPLIYLDVVGETGHPGLDKVRILTTTAPFDHCCFTVRTDFSSDREHQFVQVLFAMRYDDPKHREMMDMEGLKAWVPGRTSGYALLQDAVTIQGMFEGSIDDRAVTSMSDTHRRENRQPRSTP